jgi:membrane-bound lytic murein transglycosylase A
MLLSTAFSLLIPVMAIATQPALTPTGFADIDGWQSSSFDAAFAAFKRSCAEIETQGRAFVRPVMFGGEREDWLVACRAAASAKSDPRRFFEDNFVPYTVADIDRPGGLFTGYFEPEVRGSRSKSTDFVVPVYARPDDLVALDEADERKTGLRYGRLVAGEAAGYFTRREIESGALTGRGLEIVWLKDWADAFFIHIQGSGRVRLSDGSLIRLAYAAKSGQPYTGIGRLLVERGVLTDADMSMQAIRIWMAANPQAARELMWENRSFVFFREVAVDDPYLGPPGAQKVNLTPLASIAVDRSLWMFGTPVWLDSVAPLGTGGAFEPLKRLLIAQDTGSAIKGAIRGDVFWGAGEKAAMIAGHMKSPGKMIVLLPNRLATRISK